MEVTINFDMSQPKRNRPANGPRATPATVSTQACQTSPPSQAIHVSTTSQTSPPAAEIRTPQDHSTLATVSTQACQTSPPPQAVSTPSQTSPPVAAIRTPRDHSKKRKKPNTPDMDTTSATWATVSDDSFEEIMDQATGDQRKTNNTESHPRETSAVGQARAPASVTPRETRARQQKTAQQQRNLVKKATRIAQHNKQLKYQTRSKELLLLPTHLQDLYDDKLVIINYRVIATQEQGQFHIAKPSDLYGLLPITDRKHRTFIQQIAARFVEAAPSELFTDKDLEHFHSILN